MTAQLPLGKLPRPRSLRTAGGVLLLTLLSSSPPLAATETAADPSIEEVDSAVSPTPTPTKSGEWVLAPIPTMNPSQGFGGQLVAQYLMPSKAPNTPPAVLGLGAFYTSEQSFGLISAYQGHWRQDLWRPLFAAGYIRLNTDFYGVGSELAELDLSIPVEQRITLGVAQMLRRIHPGLYAGLRLQGNQSRISTPGLSNGPVTIPDAEKKIFTVAGGPLLQWDTRDNSFYPTSGNLANVNYIAYSGDRDYQVFMAEWNHYLGFGDDDVLALRAMVKDTSADTPFYALSQFGRGNDLRGFENGKYRDYSMAAIQAEWRHRFSRRWGGVVFAGIGSVAPDLGSLTSDDLLSSAGVGVRYRLADSQPVNFRLDVAYGDDGAAVYLGVNEAF